MLALGVLASPTATGDIIRYNEANIEKFNTINSEKI
jgi:hypothetical protein